MNNETLDNTSFGFGSAVIVAIIIYFIVRSPFHSFEQLNVFERFFFTNQIYSNGEIIRGAPGALSYIRSNLIFFFLALLSGIFWKFSKQKFNIIFISLCFLIFLKISLDYYVFGFLFKVDGGFSLFKTIILIFLLPLFHSILHTFYFQETDE